MNKHQAARLGGIAKYRKYGYVTDDEEHRKDRWKKWWNEIGQHKKNKILTALEVKYPQQSIDLAEFVGIMLGDGGMNSRQLHITLNGDTDKKYIRYVKKLLWRLFNIRPREIHIKDSKAVRILISRTNLVKFCKTRIGLKVGNKLKMGLDTPEWILDHDGYKKACIRGLFDTDGCLFREIHKINDKHYEYLRLNLTSYSPLLIVSVKQMLKELGFSCRVRRHGKALQLENNSEICNYFEVIGTSNPKHRNKFEKFIKRMGAGVV